MLEEKKIQNLTEILDPQSLDEEVNCGVIACENGKYEQAYNHLYKVYKNAKCDKATKGRAEFYLGETLRKVDPEEFIKVIESSNAEIANYKKTKPNATAYEKIGHIYRKYMYDAALNGNVPAMTEYGLNCIRLGSQGAYVYDSTDANKEAAMAWAKLLITKKERSAKVAAYVIYAKYYLYQSTKVASLFNIESFCENTIRAFNSDKSDPRACYFMGIMCGDERIKNTRYSDYYNINDSYDYFVKARNNNLKSYIDKAVRDGAPKYISLYEKSFPNMRR